MPGELYLLWVCLVTLVMTWLREMIQGGVCGRGGVTLMVCFQVTVRLQ